MTSIPAAIDRAVRRRAGNACEYCRLPQDANEFTFHVEHIIARKHHGGDDAGNLALACLGCNLHKGPNLTGIDPQTVRVAVLFHPRTDVWDDHFHWRGALLLGLTATGRATIDVLAINGRAQVAAREALIGEGRFP